MCTLLHRRGTGEATGILPNEKRDKVKIAKRYVKVFGFFMIGIPGEEESDIRETFELAKELELDRRSWSIYRPLPGSTLYDDERTMTRDDFLQELALLRTAKRRAPTHLVFLDQFRLRWELVQSLVSTVKNLISECILDRNIERRTHRRTKSLDITRFRL